MIIKRTNPMLNQDRTKMLGRTATQANRNHIVEELQREISEMNSAHLVLLERIASMQREIEERDLIIQGLKWS